jgi:hypothetical protein
MRTLDRLRFLSDPVCREIVGLSHAVSHHPLFGTLRSLADIRTLMEHHVWAVWDFMTLLKSLQARLAPAVTPWRPPRDSHAARLINEIVLTEESDLGPDGEPASHFEIYRRAMREAGADDQPISHFVGLLERHTPWERALAASGAPDEARLFVRHTLAAAAAPLPYTLAAFTIGREEIIPTMFHELVAGLGEGATGGNLRGLHWYLQRHITVDGDEHGPVAAQLWDRFCIVDAPAREQALAGARDALLARHRLWDAVQAALAPAADDLDATQP